MGNEKPVERIAHNARLHTHCAAGVIVRADLIEVPPGIDNDAITHDLTR